MRALPLPLLRCQQTACDALAQFVLIDLTVLLSCPGLGQDLAVVWPMFPEHRWGNMCQGSPPRSLQELADLFQVVGTLRCRDPGLEAAFLALWAHQKRASDAALGALFLAVAAMCEMRFWPAHEVRA